MTKNLKLIALTFVASLAVGGATIATSASAHALSCDAPSGRVEAMVCTDGQLMQLHRTMSAAARSVERRIRPRSDVPFFEADQARWEERRDGCRRKGCVVAAYAQRIETLESYAVIRDD